MSGPEPKPTPPTAETRPEPQRQALDVVTQRLISGIEAIARRPR